MNTKEFNDWFTGFVEGDGCIFTSKPSRRQFIINQKNIEVLIYIRKNLAFGTIYKYENYYRFVVSRANHLKILINILNNRIILKKTYKNLKLFATSFGMSITSGNLESVISLQSAWLAGFVDAEGCFNIRIVNATIYNSFLSSGAKRLLNKKQILAWLSLNELFNSVTLRVRLRFILDQKDELACLERIKSLFNAGSIIERKAITPVSAPLYRYYLDSNLKQKLVINYFNKYPLRSFKHRGYLKWKNILNEVLQKRHIHIKNLTTIKRYLSISL